MMIKYRKGIIKENYIEKKVTRIVKKRKQYYSDNIFCFDIEVSSGWLNEYSDVITYSKYISEEKYNELDKIALPYIWQFSYEDNIYYGRELLEFQDLLEELDEVSSVRKIIWVHNLPYEFQFMLNFDRIYFNDVFARTPRKPMRCVVKGLNIEFRCTLSLTHLSLEKWGENVGVSKKVGDLDYKIFRTPYTELTDTEMDYCEYDLRVMIKGLRDTYLERWEHLWNIPLTQTGEVRRDVKQKSSIKERIDITYMLPGTVEEYNVLQYVFCGGDTHANYTKAGKVWNDVESEDFTSSYPTVMVSEKFPISHFKKVNDDYDGIDEDYCYIMKIRAKGVKSNYNNSYLSSSRCTSENDGNIKELKADNGRVLSASELEVWLLDLDYEDFKKAYSTSEDIEILQLWRARKGYLPKFLIECVYEYYAKKTTLKGVEGEEENYQFYKQLVNALFGMCVTALLSEEIEFDGLNWYKYDITNDKVQNKLDELHKKCTENFLNYGWGVYITGYARHNLWTGIFEMDEDVLYYDTDSIKHINHNKYLNYFNNYNNNVIIKMKKVLNYYNMDENLISPKDIKGIEHTLGLWDFDGNYSEFVTLGAKRYCYRSVKDNELHITVSGVKKKGAKLLKNDIKNFKDGFIFDKDELDEINAGKMLLTYIDNDMKEFTYIDGYHSKYRYGINMRNTGYKLGITGEYKDLIQYMAYGIYD